MMATSQAIAPRMAEPSLADLQALTRRYGVSVRLVRNPDDGSILIELRTPGGVISRQSTTAGAMAAFREHFGLS